MPKSGMKVHSNYRPPPPKRRRRNQTPKLVWLVLIIIIAVACILLFRFGVFKSPFSTGEPESSGTSASSLPPESSDSSGSETSQASSEVSNTETPTEKNLDDLTPAEEPDISSASVQEFNTMMIVGDRGFRYYSFSETYSKAYVDSLYAAANALSGTSTVYSILCPTASDIVLPQSFLTGKSTSDQEKAIDYIYASLTSSNPAIKTVDLYDMLKAHCDEDIYFKTDRNWTALGAYYAYYMFAKEKGVTPITLESCTKTEYTGFKGSLFTQSLEREELDYTETLVTYTPSFNATVTIPKSDGDDITSGLIVDPSDFDSDKKYSAFLGGDYAYISVKNNDLSDGSTCIVVREAMGAAMVPFIAAHYENVIVVDYRYWTGNLTELAKNNNAKDVLFINAIDYTSDDVASGQLRGIIN